MKKVFLLIFLLCFFPVRSFSQPPIWIEATGEAQLGELDTQKEVKELAKREAQHNAVEQACGTFIKSHTLISNFQIADDLIYAAVRGKVEKQEILSEGWDDKDRSLYRVRIKALISPIYPETGDGLSIKASLSKTVLNEGEEVKIYYQSNRDCYVYIFSVAVDGSVTLLFPNSVNIDNRVLLSKTYEFPPQGSPLTLQAFLLPDFKGKTAEEKIKIIATEKNEALIPLGFREGMFKVYDANSTGMINDLVKKLNQLEPSEWTDATLIYQIAKQK